MDTTSHLVRHVKDPKRRAEILDAARLKQEAAARLRDFKLRTGMAPREVDIRMLQIEVFAAGAPGGIANAAATVAAAHLDIPRPRVVMVSRIEAQKQRGSADVAGWTHPHPDERHEIFVREDLCGCTTALIAAHEVSHRETTINCGLVDRGTSEAIAQNFEQLFAWRYLRDTKCGGCGLTGPHAQAAIKHRGGPVTYCKPHVTIEKQMEAIARLRGLPARLGVGRVKFSGKNGPF